MGNVLYAKLNVEKSKCLKALVKTYKDTVHDAGVGIWIENKTKLSQRI